MLNDEILVKKEKIGCFPLYPPLELFHAMGLNPIVLWDLKHLISSTPESDRRVQNFACSVSRIVVEVILSNKLNSMVGYFSYNADDTLRNIPELVQDKNVFWTRMHVPMNGFQRGYSRDYFKAEIRNVVTSLEKNFEISFSPEKFKESVELYRTMRDLAEHASVLVRGGKLSFAKFTRVMRENNLLPVERQIENLEDIIKNHEDGPPKLDAIPIILSGILPPPVEISECIEGCGMRVAGNDIASMHRSMAYTPPNVDNGMERYYVDFYQNHCPCPTLLYTNDDRIAYFLNMVKKSGAKAVVFLGEKFCEYEFFEFPHLEKKIKKLGLNVLTLEFSMDDKENLAQLKNRVEAFGEIVGNSD